MMHESKFCFGLKIDEAIGIELTSKKYLSKNTSTIYSITVDDKTSVRLYG